MTSIHRSAIVPQSAQRLYALVADVERYPRLFSWCSDASVVPVDASTVVARVGVRLAGLSTAFATRNRHVPGERIDMQFEEGPFRSLSGAWTFRALGDSGCRIGLDLEFEVAGRYLDGAFASGFQILADRMVDDFVRAAQAG